MANIVLTLAYDGTDYAGFQRQRGRLTVQEMVETALADLLGQKVAITGAGRTDAGVHAEMQVVNFRARTSIPMERFPYAVNRHLPPDIVVTGARTAADDFHARFSARSKVYRYSIWRLPFPSPFMRRFVWHRPEKLDVGAMRAAATFLLGRHDFSALRAAAGPFSGDAVRTLSRCELEETPGLLILRVEADGFLYKMVRTITGTLIQVGRGRWEPGIVERILASGDRRRAGPAVPPHGLCLETVRYEENTSAGSGANPGSTRDRMGLPGVKRPTGS